MHAALAYLVHSWRDTVMQIECLLYVWFKGYYMYRSHCPDDQFPR